MKNLIATLLILPLFANAQSITKHAVVEQAEKILLQESNERIAKHFDFNENGSYYSYKETGSEELLWSKMDSDTLMGKPQQIFTRFYLTMPYPECPAYDTVDGNVKLVLDSALNVVQPPDMSFLPSFVWKGEGCNLLTEAEAMTITNSYKKVHANADYIKTLNRNAEGKFIWTIIVMPNELLGQEFIAVEVNAHTGELLEKEPRKF